MKKKQLELTENHLKLFISVFKSAVNMMSNKSCCDLLTGEQNLLTQAEWKVMSEEFHKWNGDPEEFDKTQEHHSMQNFMVLEFLFEKFMKPVIRENINVHLDSDNDRIRKIAEEVRDTWT